ncbi:MAG: hydroxymethylbilane synthase [Methanomassiliicoccales archaeon]
MTIRIGSRGSRLALAQTEEVIAALRDAGITEHIEIVKVKTSGDARNAWNPQEGSFADEINKMVLDGRLDAGVHSAKDLPSSLDEGLEIAAVPERGPRVDCIVGKCNFARLPSGSKVGTSSPRRKAQLLHFRRDLNIIPVRGNIDTRLRAVENGEIDALTLALCGLKRLGVEKGKNWSIHPLPIDYFVPPAGQGALAIVTRKGRLDASIKKKVEDANARGEVEIERKAMMMLGGGCNIPAGITAIAFGNAFRLYVQVLSTDGRVQRKVSGAVRSGEDIEHLISGLSEVEGILKGNTDAGSTAQT